MTSIERGGSRKFPVFLAAAALGLMVTVVSAFFSDNVAPAGKSSNNDLPDRQIVGARISDTIARPEAPSENVRSDATDKPVPVVSTKESNNEIEGWRLFSNAKQVLACAAWLKNRQAAKTREATSPAALAPSTSDNAAPYMFSDVDPERECVALTPADIATAKDEVVRAAMLGNLDARYELLNDKFEDLKERLKNNPTAAPPAAEASQLLRDMNELAMSGSHTAGFLLSETLAKGTLGVRDEKLSIAWNMVSMQGGSKFDATLIESYGGYASATEAEKKDLLKTSRALYEKCCRNQGAIE